MAKKSKTKAKQANTKREKKYQAHHLAMILVSVLALEGILFCASSMPDWQRAATVMDVSDVVGQTAQDMSATFAPLFDVAAEVNQFYQLSATEMMHVLDLSNMGTGWELGLVYDGISDFYGQSSIQMAEVLNVSNKSFWPARVAGISLVR